MPDSLIFVAGFFTPFAFLILGAVLMDLADWWRRTPPERILKWRAWRIKRLQGKIASISSVAHSDTDARLADE